MQYIPFTEAQKQQANNTDLASFLQSRGEKLKKVGREYKLIYTDGSGQHDSITVYGSTWFDHKNQIGGGAVKFVQRFYHLTYQEAVQMLLGYHVEPVQRSPPGEPKPKPKPIFELPEPNSDMHRVYAYLIKQRYISPEIITHFAKLHTLYEDAQHHNAVFVGLDENGIPRQAHKRSTNSQGAGFRLTCGGSDTRYSFAHFGTSGRLYVFEAPIDMLSFLTLFPKGWQQHSYIAANGVYEKAVLQALETHPNLQEIVLCTDNDEGGIDAAFRFRDILREHGYADVKRLAPGMKDWNEVLKAANSADAEPAVPHRRLNFYQASVQLLQEFRFTPERATWLLRQEMQSENEQRMAEYALSGSAYFLRKSGHSVGFAHLRQKLRESYKPYADKGDAITKRRNLQKALSHAEKLLRMPARTQDETVQTAKALYEVADCALKLQAEESLAQEQTEEPVELPELGCV
ncbi:MAG: DUF3991 and toprim domain-containing protein [Oscillospiraceae bacterium]|nr:DUF3991 and toprim domain-containing protein [Oscillospiraceae bacterium]